MPKARREATEMDSAGVGRVLAGRTGGLVVTPDGRYFVVRGRLWRMSDPGLPVEAREALVRRLMQARRAVRDTRRSGDAEKEADAHAAVDAAKRALGERGPVWWSDGAPDLNRRRVRNTGYAAWYAALAGEDEAGP